MPGDSGRSFADTTGGGYQHLTTTREGLVASLRNPAASRRPEANASGEPPVLPPPPPLDPRSRLATAVDAAVAPAVLGGSFAAAARFHSHATSQARVLAAAPGGTATALRRRPADGSKAHGLASRLGQSSVAGSLRAKPIEAAAAGASPRRAAQPAFLRVIHVQYSGGQSPRGLLESNKEYRSASLKVCRVAS